MQVIRSFFILAIMASLAVAQSAPAQAKPGQNAPVPVKPPAAQGATAPAPATAAKPAASASPKHALVKKPVQPAKAPAKPAAANAAAQPAAKANTATVLTGKRDPFVSIIRNRGLSYPACPSGKRCLIPEQLVLKGIVKSPTGMLAVVENLERKAYFLRENDPVFNGQVMKITADSIIFKEKVINRAGKESVREVVKRMSKPA